MRQFFWPRRILEDLRQRQFFSTTMFCENMSTIALTKNLVFHNRTEYIIELRHCYIRELMRKTAIEFHFCRKEHLADVLPKPVATEKFFYFRDKLGVVDFLNKRGVLEIIKKNLDSLFIRIS